METRELEAKWQAHWRDTKAFEPEVTPGKPKFLCTFPYPYVNGLPHVGHLFTAMRVEAFARYKRMRGYNVLYPQGWHCTGSPIVTAAQRVREGEASQIRILKDYGIPDSDIKLFEDPKHWMAFFVPGYKADWQSLGLSIDWRREFITTDLNPRYDAFIRWQFIRLREKGLIALGKHPVVWCPKDNAAVSDHDRRSGEGETPQEFLAIEFLLEGDASENKDDNGDAIRIPVATLRPETIDGITNLWANPAIEYVKVKLDSYVAIMSKECADKLAQQDHHVDIIGAVLGKSLVGRRVTRFDGSGSIPIFPASFPKADKGTGIVMSVPSDAPDDYIALRDLQRDEKTQKEYHLEYVMDIKPIPIIDAGELGNLAAIKVVEDMKIANQKERDKLETAKKLVYKKGFYEGRMLAGDYAGEKVEVAKDAIKESMLVTGQAFKLWELTGPVVCRCLTSCFVRVVSNQWFITYGNKEWKKKTHEAVAQMRFYPEKARSQFTYVIDWLNERACSRESGLGTRLPWDEQWIIESLSDSTFYNALYTFYDILRDYPENKITNVLFDYVILGKGTPPHSEEKTWQRMRDAFLYWYPVDLRNSAKDLIQNHLAFMLFTHTALLDDKKLWPQAYGLNGYVNVDGQKMSKSLGNMIPVRAMIERYGADASRLTILNGGEGLDDPNWDTGLAQTTKQKLDTFLALCNEYKSAGRPERQAIDDWFESKLHTVIMKATEAMEFGNFRTALQYSWFELSNVIKQYLKLSNNNPQRDLMRFALETQAKLLQPYTPHVSAEAWELLGRNTMLCSESWPVADETKIDVALESSQDLIESLAGDIRNVQTLLKIQSLHEVIVIVAASWKYDFVRDTRKALDDTRNPGELMKLLVPKYKEHAQDVTKFIPSIVKDPSKLTSSDTTQSDEFLAVEGAKDYLHKAFGAKIVIVRAEDSTEQKAKVAFPGKPAIVLK